MYFKILVLPTNIRIIYISPQKLVLRAKLYIKGCKLGFTYQARGLESSGVREESVISPRTSPNCIYEL